MDGNSSPVEAIVALFGGQAALARAVGTRQGTVWGWVRARRIPYQRIAKVVAAARRLKPPVELTADDFIEIPPPPLEREDAA